MSSAPEINQLNVYKGRVPACGVFCGGCPVYTRKKKPCPGAEINQARCEGCKTFHLCCRQRNIGHCYECPTFPCYKFKRFANTWLKYGQDLITNQLLLKKMQPNHFLEYYNLNALNQVSPDEIND